MHFLIIIIEPELKKRPIKHIISKKFSPNYIYPKIPKEKQTENKKVIDPRRLQISFSLK